MSSMIYKRGQVWYWKDPIYGSKENGCQIHMGEAGLRYNRYVVIISAFDENSSFINPICMACTSNDENNESAEGETFDMRDLLLGMEEDDEKEVG